MFEAPILIGQAAVCLSSYTLYDAMAKISKPFHESMAKGCSTLISIYGAEIRLEAWKGSIP